jgi:hypothetical protein
MDSLKPDCLVLLLETGQGLIGDSVFSINSGVTLPRRFSFSPDLISHRRAAIKGLKRRVLMQFSQSLIHKNP